LRIILEALKIDKMPRAQRVHLWFSFLFAISASIYLTAPSGGQLDLFKTQLSAFLQRQAGLPFPPPVWFSVLFRQVGLVVLSMAFILIYAVHWLFASSEVTGQVTVSEDPLEIPSLPLSRGKSATGVAIRAFPSFLLLGIAMIIPYIISIPSLGIPFYVLASMLSMTIFILIFEEKKLGQLPDDTGDEILHFRLFPFSRIDHKHGCRSASHGFQKQPLGRKPGPGFLFRAKDIGLWQAGSHLLPLPFRAGGRGKKQPWMRLKTEWSRNFTHALPADETFEKAGKWIKP